MCLRLKEQMLIATSTIESEMIAHSEATNRVRVLQAHGGPRNHAAADDNYLPGQCRLHRHGSESGSSQRTKHCLVITLFVWERMTFSNSGSPTAQGLT